MKNRWFTCKWDSTMANSMEAFLSHTIMIAYKEHTKAIPSELNSFASGRRQLISAGEKLQEDSRIPRSTTCLFEIEYHMLEVIRKRKYRTMYNVQ